MIRSKLQLLLAHKADREHRKRYTYREVAAATGLAKEIIGAYVNNTVTRYERSTLDALCTWLECGVGDLLEHTPDTERSGEQGEK